MKTIVRNSLLVVIALTAVIAGYVASRWMFEPTVEDGRSIPVDFSLPDVHGKERSLSEWQAKPVVLNFWATWCGPCREEVPLLISAQKRYQKQGLRVVGVAIDNQESVAAFAKEMKIDYPLLIAEEAGLLLMSRYGNSRGFLPYTVMISRDGAIVSRHLGGYSDKELTETLNLLVNGDSSTILSK